VRSAFQELEEGWAGQTAAYVRRSMLGPHVHTRAGLSFPGDTVLGLFAGTVFMRSEPRGAAILPMPTFRVRGVEVSCFVDCSSRASRRPSGAEAALSLHRCDDDEATVVVVGDWWLSGPVPCLLAGTAAHLSRPAVLTWNFDLHGPSRYTLSSAKARAWRQAGHRTAPCHCSRPLHCTCDRHLRLADSLGSLDDSDW
jgi:hypothetical protein